MKKIIAKAAILTGLLCALTACGASDTSSSAAGTSSTETAVSESGAAAVTTVSEANDNLDYQAGKTSREGVNIEGLTNEVTNSQGETISYTIVNQYMELTDDYVEAGEDGDTVLVDRRYSVFDPNMIYNSDTGALTLDIYMEDISEELETYDAVKYLDLVSVNYKLANDTLERGDNVTYNGIEYRTLTYTGYANDGTAYNARLWIGVKGHTYIMLRTLEFIGSSTYVAYEDMEGVIETILNSIG